MSTEDPRTLTLLLNRMQSGDVDAAERVARALHATLHGDAAFLMRSERPGHTMTGEDLFQSAWIKLMGQERVTWQSRAHFRGAFAKEMRRLLIDHARTRGRLKRGGGAERVPLDELVCVSSDRGVDLLALGEALDRLERMDERKARVVEMKWFFEMTTAEIAHVLGISERQVQKDWEFTRAWLAAELNAGSAATLGAPRSGG